MKVHRMNLPLSLYDIASLHVGDKVLLSGTVITARDAAHQRLFQILQNGEDCPLDISTSTVFYCGPTPTPPWRSCGAIGPTTSARMDKYTPLLIEHGLRVMIGKGERNESVLTSIHDSGGVYLSCLGGISALLSEAVVSCETFL